VECGLQLPTPLTILHCISVAVISLRMYIPRRLRSKDMFVFLFFSATWLVFYFLFFFGGEGA
jgi:hypothetical protein